MSSGNKSRKVYCAVPSVSETFLPHYSRSTLLSRPSLYTLGLSEGDTRHGGLGGVTCRPILNASVYHCCATAFPSIPVDTVSLQNVLVTAPCLRAISQRYSLDTCCPSPPAVASETNTSHDLGGDHRSGGGVTMMADTSPLKQLEESFFSTKVVRASSTLVPFKAAQSGLVNLAFIHQRDFAFKMSPHIWSSAALLAENLKRQSKILSPPPQLGGDGPVREWLLTSAGGYPEILVDHKSSSTNSTQVTAAIAAYRAHQPTHAPPLSHFWVNEQLLAQRGIRHDLQRIRSAFSLPTPSGGIDIITPPLIDGLVDGHSSVPPSALVSKTEATAKREALGHMPLSLPQGPSWYSAADLQQSNWPELHAVLTAALTRQVEDEKDCLVEREGVGPAVSTATTTEEEVMFQEESTDAALASEYSSLHNYLQCLREEEIEEWVESK